MADPIIYAVWIAGQGWLKLAGDSERTFVSLQKEVAESAARLWGKGATVLPWDRSLLDFEGVFLKQQDGRWLWNWARRKA